MGRILYIFIRGLNICMLLIVWGCMGLMFVLQLVAMLAQALYNLTTFGEPHEITFPGEGSAISATSKRKPGVYLESFDELREPAAPKKSSIRKAAKGSEPLKHPDTVKAWGTKVHKPIAPSATIADVPW